MRCPTGETVIYIERKMELETKPTIGEDMAVPAAAVTQDMDVDDSDVSLVDIEAVVKPRDDCDVIPDGPRDANSRVSTPASPGLQAGEGLPPADLAGVGEVPHPGDGAGDGGGEGGGGGGGGPRVTNFCIDEILKPEFGIKGAPCSEECPPQASNPEGKARPSAFQIWKVAHNNNINNNKNNVNGNNNYSNNNNNNVISAKGGRLTGYSAKDLAGFHAAFQQYLHNAALLPYDLNLASQAARNFYRTGLGRYPSTGGSAHQWSPLKDPREAEFTHRTPLGHGGQHGSVPNSDCDTCSTTSSPPLSISPRSPPTPIIAPVKLPTGRGADPTFNYKRGSHLTPGEKPPPPSFHPHGTQDRKRNRYHGDAGSGVAAKRCHSSGEKSTPPREALTHKALSRCQGDRTDHKTNTPPAATGTKAGTTPTPASRSLLTHSVDKILPQSPESESDDNPDSPRQQQQPGRERLSPEARHQGDEGGDSKGDPALWPAWVYCTRYSDRPSSGPRSRKIKRLERSVEEKRPRTAFTNEQLGLLKKEFEANRYLTEERRQKLATELGLNESQIKIWFQNKRAKMKKAAGQKNVLAMQLMAQGLYNHSTVPIPGES